MAKRKYLIEEDGEGRFRAMFDGRPIQLGWTRNRARAEEEIRQAKDYARRRSPKFREKKMPFSPFDSFLRR
jgi:hypothetical protein